MCSPWHDLTTSADGKSKMCAICLKWFPLDELFEDANGQKWDVCPRCAVAEDFTGSAEPKATRQVLNQYVDLVLTEREATGVAGREALAAQLARGDAEARGWLLLLAVEEIAGLRGTLRSTSERLRAARGAPGDAVGTGGRGQSGPDVIDPRGGRACPECLRGNIWLTPGSYKIWLCAEHEKIIRKVPGWVRIDDEEAADWLASR